MYKIAVLGDRDSVAAFTALGFETFEIDDGKIASAKLKELSDSNYGIIYITERLASLVKKDIERLKEKVTPAVILIPGVSGNTGEGLENLKQAVERAVGKNILK